MGMKKTERRGWEEKGYSVTVCCELVNRAKLW